MVKIARNFEEELGLTYQLKLEQIFGKNYIHHGSVYYSDNFPKNTCKRLKNAIASILIENITTTVAHRKLINNKLAELTPQRVSIDILKQLIDFTELLGIILGGRIENQGQKIVNRSSHFQLRYLRKLVYSQDYYQACKSIRNNRPIYDHKIAWDIDENWYGRSVKEVMDWFKNKYPNEFRELFEIETK